MDTVQNILERIKKAADKTGRRYSEITVLGASKTRKPEEIIRALNEGINVFGENYVQEFLPKYDSLKQYKNKTISWHFIGHLQKNKAKYIIGKTELIHTVDDIGLASLLEKFSMNNNLATDILIEVNLSGEKSKNGLPREEVFPFIKILNDFKNLRLKGLMTMPPLATEPDQNRKYFKDLKNLLETINLKNIYKEKLDVLSMGTSGDFEIAVEEGSTLVRLGSLIFGERPQKLIYGR